MAEETYTYDPTLFDVDDETQARRLILEPEGLSTDERWKRETPALVADIVERIGVSAGQLVLDYGCGIGRIARELIARTQCRVLGVDISPGMRRLATDYVASEHFSIVSRDVFAHLAAAGLRVHHALAIWVLQHSPQLERDVELLFRSIQGQGSLYLVNKRLSVIPTDRGWVSDGKDIQQVLRRRFSEVQIRDFPVEFGCPEISKHALIGEYLRPPLVENRPAVLA